MSIYSSFVGCDGRESAKESLEKSVSNFNESQGKVMFDYYYPEAYTETINDTIISNSLIVRVKNYSLMQKNVLLAKIGEDRFGQSKYHRAFESEITIHSSSKLIFNTIINADEFIPNLSDHFWDNATLEHVWLNQDESTSELASFHISFINPQTNKYKLYQMLIDMNGERKLNLLEDS